MSEKSFLDNTPTLFVQTGPDKSQMFGMNFLRSVSQRFVLRLTGGCGLMTPEDAIGLQNLTWALTGYSHKGGSLSRFGGFCLFGGTRMIYKDNPFRIVPGITEVGPALSLGYPHCVTLGIIVKADHMRYTPHGIVVSSEADKPYATIIHPYQTSCAVLQPSSDTASPWEEEWKECVRICDSVKSMPGGWGGLLIMYNGGFYARQEVEAWAALGKREAALGQTDPFWRVLIVNGSGRNADVLANDANFLADNPTVHVCQNDVNDMRRKLTELGALVPDIEAPTMKGG